MSRKSDGKGADFVFLPLGGVGEIGMNLYLYGYGRDGAREWLIVDMGVTFGSDAEPGIDVILPDIRFIEEETAQHRRPIAHPRARGSFRRGDRPLAASCRRPGLRHAVHRRDAQIEARRDGFGQWLPLAGHSSRGPPHHRSVRCRADQHVALDPRAVRRGDQDAARRRASHRRLEARRKSADQRAHRRGPAEGSSARMGSRR